MQALIAGKMQMIHESRAFLVVLDAILSIGHDARQWGRNERRLAFEREVSNTCRTQGNTSETMPKARGHIAQGIAVQLALGMMASGQAKSKVHAAQLAGLDGSALKPASLARFAARNPIGRTLLPHAPDVLTITEKIGGKSVSIREALSTGTRSALRVLAKLGPKVGKLEKEQREHLRDARAWLEMSRSLGLFATPQPLALPSELQAQPDSSPKPDGSVDEFLESHDEPDSSAQDEGITEQRNVEA